MLDIQVTQSTTIIRRGDSFGINIGVTNAYSEQVKIIDVNISTPIGFSKTEPKTKTWFQRLKQIDLDLGLPLVSDIQFKFEPYRTEEEKTRPDKTTLVQPNGFSNYEFFLRAGNVFGFTPRPDTYKIICTIDYEKDNLKYQTKKDIEISIFPSLMGMLVGTIIGSILGTFVSANFDFEKIFPEILTNMTLGFIAGITLMRKKDVQPFVTIEDLWGGILIGFVIGYLGEQAFRNITGLVSPNEETPAIEP